MPRFFVSKENINEEERSISILGEDAFHIARSLRMAVGDDLTVCDGEGRDYDCTLTKIRDDRVDCEIVSSGICPAEPPYKATLYQALVKGERLDVAIQKSVEFGVTDIVPFESSRCIVRMKGEKEGSKSQRRRRIAAEAAKQCGRGIIPGVAEPISFADMIAEAAKACGTEVLQIALGHVTLPGYDTGFIGGAASFAPYHSTDEILFCGSLDLHPDGDAIRAFCHRHGLRAVSLSPDRLYDLGTVFLI